MKNVLITGANRGIGLGFVHHYLAQGYGVIATCRTPTEAKELNILLGKYPDQLRVEEMDVANESTIKKLSKWIKTNDLLLDIIINNAGIARDEAMEYWTADTFAYTFQVNVVGIALVVKYIDPYMRTGTKLIQMSSGRGSIFENQGGDDGLDAYSISKAALNMLTRRLATKFRSRDIIVTSINPGWVKTEMGSMSADITVEEAVDKMTKTIDALSIEDSGLFLNNDGGIVSW